MYIDTHCHLNFGAFDDDWKETAERARQAGVTKMIVVGTDLETSKKAVELVQGQEGLWAAVGFHPHHAKGIGEADLEKITKQMEELVTKPKVVAVGECGLDYHVYQDSKYEKKAITPELVKLQKQLLGIQIQLAKKASLPIIFHNRAAGEDTLDAIDHFCKIDGKYPRGVFHCISGSRKLLDKILAMGFYVGVDGNVTYSQEVQILTEAIPLDRLVLETDSPYLTPDPLRGEKLRNEPANVRIVAEFVSSLKKLSLDEVRAKAKENAEALFSI